MLIRDFTADRIYFIRYDFDWGTKVECSGGYHPRERAFSNTSTSISNARGLLYPIAFESQEAALDFIRGDTPYCEHAHISQGRSDSYVLLPVLNHRDEITWVWTSESKLRNIAYNSFEKFKSQYPRYYELTDYDPRTGDRIRSITQPTTYRGFNF